MKSNTRGILDIVVSYENRMGDAGNLLHFDIIYNIVSIKYRLIGNVLSNSYLAIASLRPKFIRSTANFNADLRA